MSMEKCKVVFMNEDETKKITLELSMDMESEEETVNVKANYEPAGFSDHSGFYMMAMNGFFQEVLGINASAPTSVTGMNENGETEVYQLNQEEDEK